MATWFVFVPFVDYICKFGPEDVKAHTSLLETIEFVRSERQPVYMARSICLPGLRSSPTTQMILGRTIKKYFA